MEAMLQRVEEVAPAVAAVAAADLVAAAACVAGILVVGRESGVASVTDPVLGLEFELEIWGFVVSHVASVAGAGTVVVVVVVVVLVVVVGAAVAAVA